VLIGNDKCAIEARRIRRLARSSKRPRKSSTRLRKALAAETRISRLRGNWEAGQTPASRNGKGIENVRHDSAGFVGASAYRALPAWPHSRAWGYYPSGGMGLILLLVVLLLLFGRI